MSNNNNHSDFSGNASTFTGVRLNEASAVAQLNDQFTRNMSRTMTDIMPKWPSSISVPMPGLGKEPPMPEAGSAASMPGAVPSLQFNIIVNGQPCGPYDMNTLAQFEEQGQFSGETIVWRRGMASWQAAKTVPDLVVLFQSAPPPIAQYNVVVNGQLTGPFSVDQLTLMAASGEFTPQNMVWKRGMSDWEAAGNVQELAAMFQTKPPPLPEMPSSETN